ncbi:MAG: WD40 repeat domain-containing protein [Byssovorax sp.]
MSPLDATHIAWRAGTEQLVLANDRGLLATAKGSTGAIEPLRRPKDEARAPRQTWMSLSADGKQLAVNDGDGRLTLWDLTSRRSRELLAPAPSSWTSPVEFSGDLKHLALARQGKLEIVSADSTREVRRFDLGADATPYSLLGWAPDGNYHVVMGKTLFGVSHEGTESFRHEISDPGAKVTISPDGRFVAIAGQSLEIVRLSDGRSVKLVLRQVSGRTEGVIEGAPDAAALAEFFEGHRP